MNSKRPPPLPPPPPPRPVRKAVPRPDYGPKPFPSEPPTGKRGRLLDTYTPLVHAFDKLEDFPRKRAMLVALATLIPDIPDRDIDALIALAEHFARSSGK